jgi:hypothetical protein
MVPLSTTKGHCGPWTRGSQLPIMVEAGLRIRSGFGAGKRKAVGYSRDLPTCRSLLMRAARHGTDGADMQPTFRHPEPKADVTRHYRCSSAISAHGLTRPFFVSIL